MNFITKRHQPFRRGSSRLCTSDESSCSDTGQPGTGRRTRHAISSPVPQQRWLCRRQTGTRSAAGQRRRANDTPGCTGSCALSEEWLALSLTPRVPTRCVFWKHWRTLRLSWSGRSRMLQVPQPVEQAWFCCPGTGRKKTGATTTGSSSRCSVDPGRGGGDSFSSTGSGVNREHGQISRFGRKPIRSKTTVASFVRARVLPCDWYVPESQDTPSSRLFLSHSWR